MERASEIKIKRAYESEETLKSRKRKRGSVTRLQLSLCIFIFSLLLALKLLFPESFIHLKELYNELWREAEPLTLEAAASTISEKLELLRELL